MICFLQTNPTAIFVFLTSLILSSHHFSTALESEVGMFSISFSCYLLFCFFFFFSLGDEETHHCCYSLSSRSLMRILLGFLSFCDMKRMVSLIYRQKHPIFFFFWKFFLWSDHIWRNFVL
jgi:hypothetical protein